MLQSRLIKQILVLYETDNSHSLKSQLTRDQFKIILIQYHFGTYFQNSSVVLHNVVQSRHN